MKVVAILATLATGAIAMPALAQDNTQHFGGDCSITGNNNGQVHCCQSGGILSGLLCNTLALGETCDAGQHVYCCNNQSVCILYAAVVLVLIHSFQGGLINLNLLNCVNL